ncbi:hypothetical protein N3K66_004828 [Trichothecium roseum]|uniref:Uncharacterized protein n=1 Tax=Trichothecium roseum TaxID=47278 RepID=A0ACC0V343_9HYPO|nr:hypothetical protein N3K66_004828 [Trichothecium roseum]
MGAATAEPPAVALSFANNFWGKDDAGVVPLIDRMTGAKQTCDELKSFYSARASIEEDYARKLLGLCRKGLGTQETGSLRTSLDTVRGEVESMAKQHQGIAAQMKSELEEPLAAFSGGMKERRKIVQNTVEKLLKTKVQQTAHVNKTRDRYEQDCLKIKGYLAQGHMVMGQEERRNKAKLEKTQISVATSNTEYESAVKVLEETTARWNREWKAAADKFQDLEEERLDFTKSSLWTFANIASTVCVSDDASCEKIRLSLEKLDVEKDIIWFISERGTGQEIPDAPRYINFCRGDINDAQSEASGDDNYVVAQFPRSINPAFRSSSPQPSTFESHHDPNSALANNLAQREPKEAKDPKESKESLLSSSREAALIPQIPPQKQSHAPSPPQAHLPSQSQVQHQPKQQPVQQHAQHPAHQPVQQPPPQLHQPSQSQHYQQYEFPRQSRQQLQQIQQAPQHFSQQYQQQPIQQQPQQPQPPRQQYQQPQQPQQQLQQASPQQQHYWRQIQQAPQPQLQQSSSQPQQQLQHFQQPRQIRQQIQHHQQPPPTRHSMDHQQPPPTRQSMDHQQPPPTRQSMDEQFHQRPQTSSHMSYDSNHHGAVAEVPHDPYPADGMTMLCRTGPSAPQSDRSSQVTSARPTSRDENSDYSNPTSLSSMEPPSGKVSPTKQDLPPASPEKPAFEKPAYEQPTYNKPAYSKPAYEKPAQEKPAYEKPMHDKPTYEKPMYDKMALAKATFDKPTYDKPTYDKPALEKPALDKPASEQASPDKGSPEKSSPEKTDKPEKRMLKKKSGFFQNHSPFRRKSVKEAQSPVTQPSRNTWHASQPSSSPTRRPQTYNDIVPQQQPRKLLQSRTQSPEPIDANASVALGVGDNVLPVNTQEGTQKADNEPPAEESDPIAMALAELKGVTVGKQSSVRMSADQYHGISTPAPASNPSPPKPVPTPRGTSPLPKASTAPSLREGGRTSRAEAPPSYQAPVSRLGVPPPAVTSKAMKEATKKAATQTRSIFGEGRERGNSGGYSPSPSSRPGTRGTDAPRAASPQPIRSASPQPPRNPSPQPPRNPSPQPQARPQPQMNNSWSSRRSEYKPASPQPPRNASPQPPLNSSWSSRRSEHAPSPSPYQQTQARNSTSNVSTTASKQPSDQYYQQAQARNSTSNISTTSTKQAPEQQHHRSPAPSIRGASPAPASYRERGRPQSSYSVRPQSSYAGSEMAVQLAPAGGDPYGSQRSRGSGRPESRAMGLYGDYGGSGSEYSGEYRQRSKSVADPSRQYTSDGRPILHYARALYMYQAAIPEELGFAKGEYLAVLRHQDDGWWEAEVHGGNGQIGLVPSNYLQAC